MTHPVPDQDLPGLFRPQAEINVTPFVDVMLVLLIIFMVTAPLLATGLKVDLPQARTAQPLDPRAPIVVVIGKDAKLALGNDEISLVRLVEAVRIRQGGDNSRVIHLHGDRDAAYGQVVAVMDELARNGINRIAIVADPRTKAEAPTPAAR